jgi:hypothetical protein
LFLLFLLGYGQRRRVGPTVGLWPMTVNGRGNCWQG